MGAGGCDTLQNDDKRVIKARTQANSLHSPVAKGERVDRATQSTCSLSHRLYVLSKQVEGRIDRLGGRLLNRSSDEAALTADAGGGS